MISIIIPVYNTEKYLRRCLDSIVAQTYKDFECIMVDDGSTDSSGTICDVFAAKDERFKVFHNENHGVGYARNYGLSKMNGEYISFVDSDDWLASNFYETLIPKITQNELVYVSDTFYYPDGTKITHQLPQKQSSNREEVEKMILYLKENAVGYPFFGYTWNKMFRTDIIRQHNIRFIENLTLCEDEVFTDAYCMYINSLSLVSEPLYNYRSDMLGLTGRKKTNEEYMLLVNGIVNSTNYANADLVAFENTRVCTLLQDLILGGGTTQQLRSELSLLRHYSKKYKFKIRRKLRAFTALGPFGWLFLKMYQLLFRQ